MFGLFEKKKTPEERLEQGPEKKDWDGLARAYDDLDVAAMDQGDFIRLLPRVLFSAPSSGSGKTVITCGVLELLRRKNLSCVSFKCGPDYIDPMFHRYVLKVPGYNLDSFFLPPEEVAGLFEEKTRKADMAVIEGAMGYYDGIAGITTHASAWEVAGLTDTPVILVVDGKKSSLSLIALVKGFLEYEKDSHIKGVVLNRTSPVTAQRLRPFLEDLGVRFLGAVPQCEEADWESRHLGLTLPEEPKRLREKVKALADRLEPCLDLDGILKLAGTAPPVIRRGLSSPSPVRAFGKANAGQIQESGMEKISSVKEIRRVAVARDAAFCFYYEENLDLLRKLGWELYFFSPLRDRCLPCPGLTAIVLGGGYPEVYARELSENQAMIKAVRTAHSQGVKILAECGGFLYLHKTLEGADGRVYPMAGIIEAAGYRTEKLSRFGYVALYDSQGNQVARGHEFHYWDSTLPGTDLKAVKPLTTRQWDCMHVTPQIIAGFPHLYYGSNPGWIEEFLEHPER